jgi:hypothetical protein
MPYDPTYPPNHAPLESAPMRGQFNALKSLIDAVPAGPKGDKGDPGDPAGVMVLSQGAAFSIVLDTARPVVFVVSAGDNSALIFHDDGSADGVWQIYNPSAANIQIAPSGGGGAIGTVVPGSQGRLVVAGGAGTLS